MFKGTALAGGGVLVVLVELVIVNLLVPTDRGGG